MNQKKWILGVSSALLVVLVFAGFMAIAAEVGSEENPLLTRDYIITELTPQLQQQIEDEIKAKSEQYIKEIDAKIESVRAEIGTGTGGAQTPESLESLANAVAAKLGTSTNGSPTLKYVKVPKGKSLVVSRETELLLRVGNAKVTDATEPALVDLTTGENLGNDKNLTPNHLYIVTREEPRLIKGTDELILFVRGKYEIK